MLTVFRRRRSPFKGIFLPYVLACKQALSTWLLWQHLLLTISGKGADFNPRSQLLVTNELWLETVALRQHGRLAQRSQNLRCSR